MACASDPAVRDVSGADVETTADSVVDTDSPDVAQACNCLGGAPIKVVEKLSLDEVVGPETYAYPGLSGSFIPTPAGGWIVSSTISMSLESASGRRLTLVGPDGEVLWNDDCTWEDEWGTWTYHECPRVSAVMQDYFVVETGGHSAARDYSGKLVWDHSPPGYDSRCSVTAPVVPGTRDRYQLDSAAVGTSGSGDAGSARYTYSLVRCDGSGAFMFRADVPGDFPPGARTLADDDGVLIIYRPGESPYPADVYQLDGIRVSFDGVISEPFEIIRWPVPSIERPLFYAQSASVSAGVLVMINFRQDENDVLQTRAALVGADGAPVWSHEGSWSDWDYGMLGTLVANADMTIDSITSYIDRDTETTYPRIRRISADGSGLEFDRMMRACPIGSLPNWDITGRYDTGLGIVLNGYCFVSRIDGSRRSFVAFYDRDYRNAAWVREYGPSSSETALVRDGDDWHLSWSVESTTWHGISGIPGCNMSIARFTGVCAQKDCGQAR